MHQSSTKRSTIADIAAKAGVSIPTVSRVLHHRPDVAPGTRRRVEQAIEESGFVRSHRQSALGRVSSGLVDIVVPDLTNAYSVEIIRGVEEVLELTDLRLALSVTRESFQLEERWLAKVLCILVGSRFLRTEV